MSLITVSFFVWLSAYSQNVIDDTTKAGGFFALEPDGTFDTSINWTLWPNGQIYDGSSENENKWSTSQYYITTGGDGYLDITQNLDTWVYIDKSMLINSGGTRSGISKAVTDPGADLGGNSNSGGTSGDLNLIAKPGSSIVSTEFGTVLTSLTADEVTILNGTYDGGRVNNNASTAYSVIIENASRFTSTNATYIGSDNINPWINGEGGAGLGIANVGEVLLINTDNNPYGNKHLGGDGQKDNGSGSGSNAGSAIKIRGTARILANNLFAEGGQAGSYKISFNRDTGAFNEQALGGSAINSTGQEINIDYGILQGTDGGSLFVTGVFDNDDWEIAFTANGGTAIDGGTGSGILSNVTLVAGNAGEMTIKDISSGTHDITLNGGDAYNGEMGNGTLVNGSLTAGNAAGGLSFVSDTADLELNGGLGIANESTAQATISSTIVRAGNAGNAVITTTGQNNNSVDMIGGNALTGNLSIQSGSFIAGDGGNLDLTGSNETSVEIYGGNAFENDGASTIENGGFYGGHGGQAGIRNGSINADGGDAIHQTGGTLIINGGRFIGGNGGVGNVQNLSASTSTAHAGLGAYITNADATLNGGTFQSGLDGNLVGVEGKNYSQVAVWLHDAKNITIQGASQLNGDLLVNDTDDLLLLGGAVNGNVRFEDGTTKFSLSNDAKINGSLILESGTVNAFLMNLENGSAYKSILIQSGDFNLTNNTFVSAPNASIQLGSLNTKLNLSQGGIFSAGSQVEVNYGTITASDLTIKENATLSIAYDGTANGNITLTGDLDLSATGAKVLVQGKANTSSGTIDFLTASSVNGVEKIEADLGWLTSAEVNTNTYQVSYQYKPLTGYISGISSSLNNMVGTNDTLFLL